MAAGAQPVDEIGAEVGLAHAVLLQATGAGRFIDGGGFQRGPPCAVRVRPDIAAAIPDQKRCGGVQGDQHVHVDGRRVYAVSVKVRIGRVEPVRVAFGDLGDAFANLVTT